MHEETKELRTKVLDRSNKEIMLEIKQAYEEIKELRQAVTDISTEQESLKVQHQALQQDHMSLAAKVTDPVPWNIREIFNSQLQTWRKEDKIFVTTSTVKKILKCCKENFCVTITGNSGIGKTMILRHVGSIMAEEGYDVIPVDDPGDIKRYYNPKKKTLFVVDDFCGKYAADRNQVSRWETLSNNYRYIEKNTKIIVSCRLQVYQDILFSVLSLFKSCVCDISSKDFNPSKKELRSIAAVYLKENVDKIDDSAYSFDCFPLLCKLYSDNPSLGLEFFQHPFTVYENELNQMCVRQEAEKYCALALCVVFNNCVEVKLLTDEIGPDLRSVFGNIFEACKLNRETSRLLIRDSLDVLVNTYIMKEGDVYKTIHDKIFDFLSFYFGKKILTVLIKNADIKWIGERLLLDEYKFGSEPEFTVIAPQEYLLLLDNRLKSEWLNGHIERVFLSVNMKNPKFREHFLQYIESGETLEQSTLAKTTDISTNINMLMIFAFYGDKQWAEWCFKFGINVNRSDANGASPLHAACWSGNNNTEMVQMLLEKKANINQCTTDNGSTPLLICCLYGHTEICQILIDNNADVNQCTTDNFNTPLYLACQSGHTDIVKKLIENKADINKCSSGEGATPLYIACHQGRAEIVKMLLKKQGKHQSMYQRTWYCTT